MAKGTLIFCLGILLVVVPAFGIPWWWKQIIITTIGVLLIGLGYSIRRKEYLNSLQSHDHTVSSETFVESTTPLFDTTR
jgi:membrane protein implicated in regulation of membrane protease activity